MSEMREGPQINKEIAEDAAYREQDRRDTMAYGVGLAIGAMAMGDVYATGLLRMAARCVDSVAKFAAVSRLEEPK